MHEKKIYQPFLPTILYLLFQMKFQRQMFKPQQSSTARLPTAPLHNKPRFLLNAFQIIPILGSDVAHHRQGAIECLSSIIDTLAIEIVPFIVLLIIPVLRRMSDQVGKVLKRVQGEGRDQKKLFSHIFKVLILKKNFAAGFIAVMEFVVCSRQFSQTNHNWFCYKMHSLNCIISLSILKKHVWLDYLGSPFDVNVLPSI